MVVADDHWGFRNGMRALLASQPDAELVGEATTGPEAVQAAHELAPDVVLMDLTMPAAASRRPARSWPPGGRSPSW